VGGERRNVLQFPGMAGMCVLPVCGPGRLPQLSLGMGVWGCDVIAGCFRGQGTSSLGVCRGSHECSSRPGAGLRRENVTRSIAGQTSLQGPFEATRGYENPRKSGGFGGHCGAREGLLGWVGGGGVVGVLFSKSPRGGLAGCWFLRVADPLFVNSLEMVVFVACWFRVGLVWLLVWVLGTGFALVAGTG
jgi:hypothetical protein